MSADLWGWDGYLTADELVTRIQRGLRAAGVDFDDLDERIAAELGVPPEAWSGYLQVRRACERYQAGRRATVGQGHKQREKAKCE